jgi:uncharacterized protein (TIGR03067 family)
MGPHALILLVVGSFLAVNDPKVDLAKEEITRLQGTWSFVSMEVQGVKTSDKDFKKYTVVLEGDQYTVSAGDKIAAQTTFRLDPTKKPKTIDLIDIKNVRVIRGIYSLEADKLTICDRGAEKGARPTEFATRPDSGLVLVVLKRDKPAGPKPEDAIAKERTSFQGTWRFVSLERDQKPEREFEKYTAVLKGDQWTVSEGDRIAAQTFFRPDPTKTPKTIDIVDIENGRVIREIYSLKTDTLTVCDRGEKDRPTEFATKPDSGLVLFVLKRTKP